MQTTCTNCAQIFEAQGNDTGTGICYACALHDLTDGRPPEIEDFTTAAFMSREMSKAEWRDFQAELRRYHPGDFYQEEPEWCSGCDSYQCRCAERRAADERRDEELYFDSLYYEALDEDQDRTRNAEQKAEQAKWDAEIVEWERIEAEHETAWALEQEWNDTFSPFLYNSFGWTNYNRFAAPILIGILRIKKRWLR